MLASNIENRVLRMRTDPLVRTALRWTQQGKGKRGRQKETVRRSMGKKLKGRGRTFQQAEIIFREKMKWRLRVNASVVNGR